VDLSGVMVSANEIDNNMTFLIIIISITFIYILGGFVYEDFDKAHDGVVKPVTPFHVTRPPFKDATWALALMLDPKIRQVQAREYMNSNGTAETTSDAHFLPEERGALTTLAIFQFVIYTLVLLAWVLPFFGDGDYIFTLTNYDSYIRYFPLTAIFISICYILGGFRYKTIDDAQKHKLTPAQAFEVDSVPFMDSFWVLSLIDPKMRKAVTRLYRNGTGKSESPEDARLTSEEKGSLKTLAKFQFSIYFIVFLFNLISFMATHGKEYKVGERVNALLGKALREGRAFNNSATGKNFNTFVDRFVSKGDVNLFVNRARS
jgi:hypothetical protein